MGDDSLDTGMAETLARDRLIERLRPPAESTTSDTARLVDSTTSIIDDLERGKTPDKSDIERATYLLGRVQDRLDEIATLFGWSRWETGATWGELTAEQRCKVYEYRKGKPNPSPERQGIDSWDRDT
ncbi:hypothetical protein [Natrinema pallidum]|uniref:Uncharacterized protein n=2 Tax=Natrinema pallidum TaxID=69527 RepID=L9Z8K4_9EURY|nr:hypothetical protein [Natrinema pallidum]ELY82694.1 hypothetical protein C487_01405 [Natrinema pallidum DSM 3751]QCW03319.1 hypothetical protein FGF80_08740 [Natrinema pallidum]